MKVGLVAGGSGGHIYPAIALYNKLIENKIETIVYSGPNKLEKLIYSSNKIDYRSFNFISRSKGLIKFSYNFIRSYFKVKADLKREKIDVALGFGGYPSLGVLLACKHLKIPYLIHEQNGVLGRANKFLLKGAEAIITCFENVLDLPNLEKIKNLGNPRSFNLPLIDHQGFNVLIMMGSQGSSSINELLIPLIEEEIGCNIKLVTGKSDYDRYLIYGPKVVAYIDDMEKELQTTDLVICRAGATTINELSSMGIPAILIPSPNVTNNHQLINAKSYVKDWGIYLEEKKVTAAIIKDYIVKIKNDYAMKYYLKKKSKDFCKLDAAENIIMVLKEYAKK